MWIFTNPVAEFNENIPGMDNKPEGAMSSSSVNFGGYSEKFEGSPSILKGSWPQFRGPSGDNISSDKLSLLNDWGNKNPSILWDVDLGEGHSGPIVSDGKVFILDYDEDQADKEV